MNAQSDAGSVLRCSFCGKRSDEVGKLIAGRGVGADGACIEANVCDECASLHVEVIASGNRDWLESQLERWRASRIDELFAAGAAAEPKES